MDFVDYLKNGKAVRISILGQWILSHHCPRYSIYLFINGWILSGHALNNITMNIILVTIVPSESEEDFLDFKTLGTN